VFDLFILADIATLYRQSVGMYKDLDATQLKLVKSKWPKLRAEPIEKFILELEKERINKETWRKSFVPSYFESVWGKHFLDTGVHAEKEKLKVKKFNAEPEHTDQAEFVVHESFDGIYKLD
jgi:hypothetical protein